MFKEKKKKAALYAKAVKDGLFLDYEAVEHESGYAVVMVTISSKDGVRIVAFGEVRALENPFLKAMNNALVTGLGEFYEEEITDDDLFGNDTVKRYHPVRKPVKKITEDKEAQKETPVSECAFTDVPDMPKDFLNDILPGKDTKQDEALKENTETKAEDAEKSTEAEKPVRAEKTEPKPTKEKLSKEKAEVSESEKKEETKDVPEVKKASVSASPDTFPQDIFGGISFSDDNKKDFYVLIGKYADYNKSDDPEIKNKSKMSWIAENDLPFLKNVLSHMTNPAEKYKKTIRAMKRYLLACGINPFADENA